MAITIYGILLLLVQSPKYTTPHINYLQIPKNGVSYSKAGISAMLTYFRLWYTNLTGSSRM